VKVSVIMLGVSDMLRSVEFYRNRLGLEVTTEGEAFTFLSGGGVTLALSRPHFQSLGKEPGCVEVVFLVDHVRETYDLLRARGIEFKNEPRPVTGPQWAANFTGPNGHMLSVFGPE
jgi:catechol 2,3-dioxygenase-like lactoylglutathione lyase family enzyme